MRTSYGLTVDLRETGQPLEISLIDVPLRELTASEYQRVFAEIAQQRPGGILVSDASVILSRIVS